MADGPDATLGLVRRLARALLVAFLAVGSSGASALIAGEPCVLVEEPAAADADCMPTCVTCGCCAQATEATAIVVATAPAVRVAAAVPLVCGRPEIPPRDILHIPKRHPA
jgi:hypothetical protein